jgi:pseudouridine kinase
MTSRDADNGMFALTIGGANIDIHGRSSDTIKFRDSNPGHIRTSPGGVARNVAENLTRLGVDSRLVSIVGNDHYGRMLLRLSREAGVDVEAVQITNLAPTSTYLSVLDDSGEMQVAISDMSIVDLLTAEKMQPLKPFFKRASLIVLDTNLGESALDWLTDCFAEKPIFADTVSTSKAVRLSPYLSAIHSLKTNVIEVEALTGQPARTPDQLRRLANGLHADGIVRLFVTLGDQGVFFSADDKQAFRKPIQSEQTVLNTGGAGDAFLAGLAYSWLEELTLDDSVQFALAAAAIAVEHAATNNPSLSVAAVASALDKHANA